MPTDPPADVTLTPLDGESRTLAEWLVTFHLVVVVVDPYTYESAWLLQTAARILRNFTAADVRVGWVVTAEAEEAKQFLGPLAKEFLTFADPGRGFVKATGLEQLPALVHVNMGSQVAGAAEGWNPDEWRKVLENLARTLDWSKPVVPGPGDPSPYAGSPALG